MVTVEFCIYLSKLEGWLEWGGIGNKLASRAFYFCSFHNVMRFAVGLSITLLE